MISGFLCIHETCLFECVSRVFKISIILKDNEGRIFPSVKETPVRRFLPDYFTYE